MCVYLCMGTTKLFDPEVSYSAAEGIGFTSMLTIIRDGVKFNLFMKLVKQTPFTILEWSHFLHISERTMHRYQTEKKSFDTTQSEKIVQIAMLYKKGTEVFSDAFLFNQWLISNNISLGNKTPKSFLDTSLGISLLMDELIKIEHGIFA